VDIELEGRYERPTDLAALETCKLPYLRFLWVTHIPRIEHLFARGVAWTATRTCQVTVDWRGVRPIVLRTSAHLAILLLALAAVAFSGMNLPTRGPMDSVDQAKKLAGFAQASVSVLSPAQEPAAIALPASQPAAAANTLVSNANALGGSFHWVQNDATIVRLAQPHTEIPIRPRLSVITHTVQAGETVESIAALYRLEPTTVLWSNLDLEEMPDMLRIGQKVAILPVDGVYHTVTEDDTLASIAEKYKVEVAAITGLSFNSLREPVFLIQPGMKLIVPGGTKPYVPRTVTSFSGPVPTNSGGTGMFMWPVGGALTQGYWYGHRAIDIGAPTGSAVVAGDTGYVSFAGWTDIGYGYLIIVDHANGYSSYYAHLSQLYVLLGQQVDKGQVIGAVGSTGNSTGPHLHLEIRYNGVEQNPLVLLP
jgi:murein DD-endopeptidase MepM/ murein hydrolase activator NlpD